MKTDLKLGRIKILVLSEKSPPFLAQFIQQLEQRGVEVVTQSPVSELLWMIFADGSRPEEEIIGQLQEIRAMNGRPLVVYEPGQVLPHFRAVSFLESGAVDVLHQMEYHELLETVIARMVRSKILHSVTESALIRQNIVGACSIWRSCVEQAAEVACFSQSAVLISGESGTGKELIARLIHDLDRRPDKGELVLLDCTTVVSDLSGSEFFGHEKGAFTNALSMREGVFALADGGTLFLDEIGELPLPLQAELLRVIQEGTFKRLGSNQWKKTNFRLICATNRNLEEEVRKGQFRQDLFYRIASCMIELPPLRNRKEDIETLLASFLQDALKITKAPALDKHVRNFLLTHDFPGNVRELKQLAHRISPAYLGLGRITIGNLYKNLKLKKIENTTQDQQTGIRDYIRTAIANGLGLKEIKKIAANIAMEIAIEDNHGNLQLAAQQLQVSDRTLQHFQAAKNSEPAFEA